MDEAIKIGAYVVYGKMGVCRVQEQQSMSFGTAGSGLYYVLCPVSDGRSSVYVPCDNPELMGRMRPLLSPGQIDTLLAGVEERQLDWVEDRNQRSTAFRAILGSGDRCELIRLIRCLYRKKQEKAAIGKRLSSMDEALLQDCIRLVEEEFSLSLGISRDAVGEYIRTRLDG